MHTQTQLLVIGAGIVGCSTVYHLAQMGCRDIVVLEQGPLFETGGSTSHAPGLVFQTSFSKMMTDLAMYTVNLYSELELDGLPCFYSVGSMEVNPGALRRSQAQGRGGQILGVGGGTDFVRKCL